MEEACTRISDKGRTRRMYDEIRRSKAIAIGVTMEISNLTKRIKELELQRERLLEWVAREEDMQDWRRDFAKLNHKAAA